jgi:hypothetical protein
MARLVGHPVAADPVASAHRSRCRGAASACRAGDRSAPTSALLPGGIKLAQSTLVGVNTGRLSQGPGPQISQC